MKIVIEIDDDRYEKIINNEVYAPLDICVALYNGTPLPEHHGRLIECEPIYDKLTQSYRADKKDNPERGKDYRVGLSNAIDLLIKAPTIIEGSDSE